jgi:UDPglucose 6-dehydrogenase
MKLVVYGHSHLSYVYSSVLAEKGLEVFLIDVLKRFDSFDVLSEVSRLAEPGLKELFKSCLEQGKLKIVQDSNDVFLGADFVVLAVDTPLLKENSPDYTYIVECVKKCSAINSSLPILLLSQVFPGFTRQLEIQNPIYYLVETLVFGNALDRLRNPEQIIIGSKDSSFPIPNELEKLLITFNAPIKHMSWESAELTKIAFNFILANSVIASNLLANISEARNASWKDIKQALKDDSRIGAKAYVNSGLGITGGNLPRDISTLKMLAKDVSKDDLRYLESLVIYNDYLGSWISNILRLLNLDHGNHGRESVILLGMSYKVGTSSIVNSPAIRLLEEFPSIEFKGIDIDPVEIPFFANFSYLENFNEAIKYSKVIILTTPWPQFIMELNMDHHDFSDSILLDPWGVCDKKLLSRFRRYFQRGEFIDSR